MSGVLSVTSICAKLSQNRESNLPVREYRCDLERGEKSQSTLHLSRVWAVGDKKTPVAVFFLTTRAVVNGGSDWRDSLYVWKNVSRRGPSTCRFWELDILYHRFACSRRVIHSTPPSIVGAVAYGCISDRTILTSLYHMV